MKSNKLTSIILSGALVLAIVLTSSILIMINAPTDVYKTKMASAEKFLSDGDYDNAILSLKEAIRKNENDPEPYLMLADIYVQSGKIKLAVSILKQGWTRTKSARIKLALTRLGVVFDEDGEPRYKSGENEEDVAMAVIAMSTSINDSLLTRFARSTYSDYGSNYTIEKETPTSGVYTVSYVGLDAEFSYYNSDRDPNVLGSSGRPDGSKLPSEIFVKDLSIILPGAANGLSYEKLQTMNIYNLRKSYSNTWKCDTVEFDSFDCRITVDTDANGNIKGSNSKNIIAPLGQSQGGAASQRTLQGRIISVTTGSPVSGVYLRFRSGVNAKDGTVDYETSAPDGNYTLSLSSGEYTAEVSATGYMTEYFPIYVSETNEVTSLDFALSPILAEGEIRIVLEWDANPRDLDSHLEGTSSSGSSIHTWFSNKIASSGNGKIAELDLDDTDGFGPETTTIYDSGGNYDFKVHHFSGSGNLSTSGAVVKVYMGGQAEPVRIEVPSTVTGLYWNVCSIRNGQLTINEG